MFYHLVHSKIWINKYAKHANSYSYKQYDKCIISVQVLFYYIYYWRCKRKNNHDTHNIHMHQMQLWDINDALSFGLFKYMNPQIYHTCQPISDYIIWCIHHICVCVRYPIYHWRWARQSKHNTHNIHMHEM